MEWDSSSNINFPGHEEFINKLLKKPRGRGRKPKPYVFRITPIAIRFVSGVYEIVGTHHKDTVVLEDNDDIINGFIESPNSDILPRGYNLTRKILISNYTSQTKASTKVKRNIMKVI